MLKIRMKHLRMMMKGMEHVPDEYWVEVSEEKGTSGGPEVHFNFSSYGQKHGFKKAEGGE